MALFQKLKTTVEASKPLTEEQQTFLDAIRRSGPGQAFGLEAKAGTGKTYTIIRAADHLEGRTLMLAFNAKIRKELQARAPANCTVHTFHSYCNGALQDGRRLEIKPGTAKTYAVLKDPKVGVQNFRARWPIAQGISLAKNLAFDILIDGDKDAWTSIFREYDIRIPRGVREEYVVEQAMRVFGITTRDKRAIDYDDMLYYAASNDAVLRDVWDYVIVDEAQDTNPVQLAVLDRLMANGKTRLIFVGDPQQAIYGWRGAGVDAFSTMAERYGAQIFDLTTTWRCPRRVVEEAQRIVPKIRCADNAHEGEVLSLAPGDFDATKVAAGNAILCRNNAPLLRAALACLQASVPCVLLGRDMSKAIVFQTGAAFDKYPGALSDAGAFYALRGKYEADLHDRPFALAQALEEVELAQIMHGFLVARGDEIGGREEMVDAIERVCDRLLCDELRSDRLVLSTIHRSKGLEWDTVYLIAPEKLPSKAARKMGGWHLTQEHNLLYVAITRAKQRFVYVTNTEDPLSSVIGAGDMADAAEQLGLPTV